jgi:hypothetical protein
MWLGLLFTIICAGTFYQGFLPGELTPILSLPPALSDPNSIIESYREKIVQCLISGKYTRTAPYTIETLLMYLQIELLRSPDSQIEMWILLGIIVRLAMRMGYHRDGSHFLGISPFQAEMRRRVWVVVLQMDAGSASQFGLPRMARESQCDTNEPRNLLDEDLDRHMAELPPSRGDQIKTAVLYLVAKNRLISAFGMISDSQISKQLSSYKEVMRLDEILEEAYKSVPPWLLMRPMTKSIMDNPETVLKRVYIDLVYHRAKCVLHREYMLPARKNNSYIYSRTACIGSSLQMLHIQSILHQETQVAGRLYQDRWKISSLIQQNFLLAATTLCLDLDQENSATGFMGPPIYSTDTPTTERVIRALEESHAIFLHLSGSSREAKKAAGAIKIVLGRRQNMAVKDKLRTGNTTLDRASCLAQAPNLQSQEDYSWVPIGDEFTNDSSDFLSYDPTFPSHISEAEMESFDFMNLVGK